MCMGSSFLKARERACVSSEHAAGVMIVPGLGPSTITKSALVLLGNNGRIAKDAQPITWMCAHGLNLFCA
jgi:hypothetical protein